MVRSKGVPLGHTVRVDNIPLQICNLFRLSDRGDRLPDGARNARARGHGGLQAGMWWKGKNQRGLGGPWRRAESVYV